MPQLEYPDLDRAMEQAVVALSEETESGVLLIVQDRDTGKWTCRINGPGDAVVITDTYELMIQFLEARGII